MLSLHGKPISKLYKNKCLIVVYSKFNNYRDVGLSQIDEENKKWTKSNAKWIIRKTELPHEGIYSSYSL